MPKQLSVVTVIEKNRLSSDTPFLLALDIDVVDPATGSIVSTGHYVNNPDPIYWNNNNYTPAAFDINIKEDAGSLQTVQLQFVDYSREIQAQMQAYGGGVGFKVTFSVVNAGNLSGFAEVQEFFEVVGAESADYVCSFTLGAENAISRNFPRRHQTRDFCQFRFRGVQCGYAGALTTCDLSLKGPNGCEAHGNQARFGGYPGINTKDIRYA